MEILAFKAVAAEPALPAMHGPLTKASNPHTGRNHCEFPPETRSKIQQSGNEIMDLAAGKWETPYMLWLAPKQIQSTSTSDCPQEIGYRKMGGKQDSLLRGTAVGCFAGAGGGSQPKISIMISNTASRHENAPINHGKPEKVRPKHSNLNPRPETLNRPKQDRSPACVFKTWPEAKKSSNLRHDIHIIENKCRKPQGSQILGRYPKQNPARKPTAKKKGRSPQLDKSESSVRSSRVCLLEARDTSRLFPTRPSDYFTV